MARIQPAPAGPAPGSVFAEWDAAELRALTSALRVRGPGAIVIGGILSGVTAFLCCQVAPAIMPYAQWVYVPLKALVATGDDVVRAVIEYIIAALSGTAASSLGVSLATRLSELEACLTRGQRVVVCIDDGDLCPAVVSALVAIGAAGDKLRLLVGAHEPLGEPLIPFLLPPLNARQIAHIIGHGIGADELSEILRWTGGIAVLVRDLGIALRELPEGGSRIERVRAAARQLCALGPWHPFFRRLLELLTRRDLDFLSRVIASGGLVGHRHPDLDRLVRLGILQSQLGSVQFKSAIVAHWLSRTVQTHCILLTEKSAEFLLPAEADARLEDAIKSPVSVREPYLIVDRIHNRIIFGSRDVELAPSALKLLRIVLSNAANHCDPSWVTPREELQQPRSDQPLAWVHTATSDIARQLDYEVLKNVRSTGWCLAKTVHFLWIEALPAAPTRSSKSSSRPE